MNHIDNKQDINIIIARYFDGSAAPDEIKRLRQWIEQSPDNKKIFFEQQDLWEALTPSFSVSESDTEKAERKVMAKAGIVPRGSGIIRKLFVLWSRIAAVAILPLIAITVFFLARPGNSSLSYPQNMHADSRDVNLQGEAYFDVHSDAAHPFIVHTPYISVTATGTEFNVNAYDSDVSVTLAEGKVEITDAGKRTALQPGEHLQIENGIQTVSKNVDLNKYCSWRNGVLIFEDEPINNICRRLAQIYNVKFDIDPSLSARTFRFILKGENLSEIMNLFQLTAPVTCITENDCHSADSIDLPQTIHIKPI